MSSTNTIPIENIFVTVGSTRFDQLIDNVIDDNVVEILKHLGCRRLTIQYGSYKDVSKLESVQNVISHFEVELFDYQNSIQSYIDKADLVIGHAGAGTVLEVLRKRKPLLIVINDTLMDNHQEELAIELAEQRFVRCCYPSTLKETLKSFNLKSLIPFPEHDSIRFRSFIESVFQQ
ncbi:hypothetical protein RDWZM_009044 [Blomia tropicalis]|uniref:UDP-N-acetylglucosamine transferase subunit ALG13 n=1 Tax=Blomia tropicalis TaxID=40697 RepID=A0A9Q0M4P9_BLOTA|nr:transferase [Blomia tropicalis]KAJ6217887.1 hypothetical protein RDWZM_009044 [Blomia tropicalis]